MKRREARSRAVLMGLLAAGLCGCGGKTSGAAADQLDAAVDATESLDPAQVPPATSEGLDAWIANEPWKAWTCEPAPRGPRLNSPHDQVRVCENDLLTAALAAGGAGDLPVGAAAVKEMYDQGSVWSYTIAVRGKSGSGVDKWFWWRKVIDGSTTPAITNQGYGDVFCSGCHVGAAAAGGRDSIFTILSSS
jgi:hypothetical protein